MAHAGGRSHPLSVVARACVSLTAETLRVRAANPACEAALARGGGRLGVVRRGPKASALGAPRSAERGARAPGNAECSLSKDDLKTARLRNRLSPWDIALLERKLFGSAETRWQIDEA